MRRWARAPTRSSGRWPYALWLYLLTMAMLATAMLTAHYVLPTTYYLLLTTHCLPPTPSQLELAQQQTLAVEARLREGNQLAAAPSRPKPHGLRSPGPGSALQPAGSALSARAPANARRTPPLRPQSAQGAAAAAAAVSGRQGLGAMTALQGGGLGWGPTAIQPRAENPDIARGNRPPGSSLSASAPRPRNGGPPALSIGFGAEGSAPVAAAPAAPVAPPRRKTTPGLPMGRHVPVIIGPASSLQAPQ